MQTVSRKTILFRSPEFKSLFDALIQVRSEETGVGIMRLIENALFKEFGFKTEEIMQWCKRYMGCDDIVHAYAELFDILQNRNDSFEFYKMICKSIDVPVCDNDRDKTTGVSGQQLMKQKFQTSDAHSLHEFLTTFLYDNSDKLDSKPLQIETIIPFLFSVDERSETP